MTLGQWLVEIVLFPLPIVYRALTEDEDDDE